MDCLPSQIPQNHKQSQNHNNLQELTKPTWEAGTRLTTQLQP
ncbi:hypothetical protein HMPREF1583_00637 [Gardnerella vaginalis JCP8151B]|nr:hypothetical protein HMPREF1583_00637 [Gardnerella vaginalis JCP8151B]